MKTNMMKGLLIGAALSAMTLTSTTAFAAGPWEGGKTAKNAEGNISLTFSDIQITLPASWSGKCRMGQDSSGDALMFYHVASRDAWTNALGYANGGTLFSIVCSPDYDISQDPESYYLGTGSMGDYYWTQPTDYQGYNNDSSISSEFTSMNQDLSWIRERILINGSAAVVPNPGTYVNSSEYIFPHSSDSYLSAADLSGMTYDEVQMAINEIYARHHRLFITPEIQAYFNGKSWYDGYIAANDFNVNVMNTYEVANIDLMVKQLDRLQSGTQTAPQQSGSTKSVSGTIIETGRGYFRVQFADKSIIQFWYDSSRIASSGLWTGASISMTYDVNSYEALSVSTR